MLKQFTLILLMVPALAFGQRNKEKEEKLKSFNNEYGYVNGVRLDSIQGEYAEVSLTAGMAMASGISGATIRRYTFNTGNLWKKESEIRVNDKDGNVIQFNGLAETLNFFSFNGWEMVMIDAAWILLRKKNRL